ncbi:hypothetical protein [Butyrivibrio sp. AE2032]|uniref:hypothetical protein n=1 Tax=Butyrivibrio sp. AE2032 TaxID=1458463 RepID=UPI000555DF1E|nr:hypothetical protein [Butyrivibrio sp. AE2032]
MKKQNYIKMLIPIILVLSIVFSLCGCGLNEYQQQFVDAVGVAENATDENSLDAIKNAFLKYSTLSEKDSKNKDIEDAKTRLITLFDSKIDTLSQEEMSASLDAKISEYEAVVNELPVELQNSIPGCEKLKTIRADHLNWYVDQNKIIADKIDEISEQFDALNMAETVSLIDETIPMLEDMKKLSYENNIEEIKKEFGIITPDEGIEILNKVKDLIVEMCYTDCYAVRFEYICEYNKQALYSEKDHFMYFYSTPSTTGEYLGKYMLYLDAHFELISKDIAKGKWTYDVGCDIPLTVTYFVFDSYGIYAVEVFPPYMLPEEQGINNN